METLYFLYYPELLNVLLLLFIVELIVTIVLRVKENVRGKEKSKKVQAIYPELSKKELKFRETSIMSYYRINSNQSFRDKLAIFFVFVLIAAVVMIPIFLFYENYSGLCFAGATVCLSLAIFTPSERNYMQILDFWEKYLEENPDNPLKVVPRSDKKDLRLIKFAQFNAFLRILCGLYSLFMGLLLFQQNL